ncbi:MAG TPA: hypothetical protein PKN62_01690 [bacterium]|nr:hypothetical protein [bacterium]
MLKRLIILGSLFVLITGFSFYALATHDQHSQPLKGQDNQNPALILYYGETCPHCKIVEKYIADNKIDQKLAIAQKEVYNNTANSQELLTRAKSCQLDTATVGVPFLWTGSDCLIGDQPIIDFLNKQIK